MSTKKKPVQEVADLFIVKSKGNVWQKVGESINPALPGALCVEEGKGPVFFVPENEIE